MRTIDFMRYANVSRMTVSRMVRDGKIKMLGTGRIDDLSASRYVKSRFFWNESRCPGALIDREAARELLRVDDRVIDLLLDRRLIHLDQSGDYFCKAELMTRMDEALQLQQELDWLFPKS